MSRQYFVEQEFRKRNIMPEWTDQNSHGQNRIWDDEEAYSYADAQYAQEEQDLESADRPGKRKKSPARLSREREFMALYEELLHPTKPRSARQEEYLLADLHCLLRNLNTGWAYRKAERYRALFPNVDEDMALAIGCEYAHSQLIEDHKNKVYYSYALAHYLRIAQNKAIDHYFRAEFGRIHRDPDTGEWNLSEAAGQRKSKKQPPYVISLEDMMTDSEGVLHDDRNLAISCDPFRQMRRPAWQRDAISQRIALAYLKCVLDYDDAPPKALALMYGSILFQIARALDSEDPLAQAAKKSKVLSSPKWAFLKMGDSTLYALGEESQGIVSRYYGIPLRWGIGFTEMMQEYPAHSANQTWGDIVYTQTYTREDTSNWIESIGDSMALRAAHLVYESRELREYVLDTLAPHNRLRAAMEKLRKEVHR